MGRKWFPRTLAQWKEPKAFVRWRTAEDRKSWPWRVWYLFVVLFALLTMGFKFVGSNGFLLPPASEVIRPLCSVLFLAVIPFVPVLVRSVWIREDGIFIGGSSVQGWHYEKLLRVIPANRELDGRRYTVLRLERLDGQSVEVAVADTISLTHIEEILRAQGVRYGG